MFTCEFLLPQHCDNNFSYNAYIFLLSQYCVNNDYYYTSKFTLFAITVLYQ